jgi:quinolinate synthase
MVQSINATTPLEEARAVLADNFDLTYTKAVAKVTAAVREKLKSRLSDSDWPRLAPLIVHINRLKREKKAVILAHVQQPPEIYFGVADKAGDNLRLLQEGVVTRQPVVIVAGVHSMAENLKLLLKGRTVLSPDSRVRCSLASSITFADVEAIRSQYPGVKVLVHVNAPIGVKLVADACFTAANGAAIVEATEGERVIMLPDQFLAQNVAFKTSKKIITWAGSADAFSGYEAGEVEALRATYPDAKVIAHPQNRPSVTALSDFTGSETSMAEWLASEKPPRVIVLSDSAIADNLAVGAPHTEFIPPRASPVNKHRLTLESILWSLHTMSEPVNVPAELSPRAAKPLQRMIELTRRAA